MKFPFDLVFNLDPAECWFLPSTLRDPRPSMQGATTSSHRYFYKVLIGDLKATQTLKSTCHNRECRNPFHYVIGTRKNNGVNLHPEKLRLKKAEAILQQASSIDNELLETITDLTENGVITLMDIHQAMSLSFFHVGQDYSVEDVQRVLDANPILSSMVIQ